MSKLRIPNRNGLGAYTMTVTLEGTTYDFLFRWSARDESWHMDISRLDVPSVRGVKVVNSQDLLAAYAYKRADGTLPPGTLKVEDSAGLFRDPDTTTLGDDVVLFYDEAA